MALLLAVVRGRCGKSESSRSLSHLLMSFLFSVEYACILYASMCIMCGYDSTDDDDGDDDYCDDDVNNKLRVLKVLHA